MSDRIVVVYLLERGLLLGERKEKSDLGDDLAKLFAGQLEHLPGKYQVPKDASVM